MVVTPRVLRPRSVTLNNPRFLTEQTQAFPWETLTHLGPNPPFLGGTTNHVPFWEMSLGFSGCLDGTSTA